MLADRTFTSTLNRMFTLNRALDQALAEGWQRSSTRILAPALDIVERGDSYVMSLELPGVDPKTIDLSFDQNVLTVKGTKPAAQGGGANGGDLRVYADERVSGAFERSIRLPRLADGAGITAEASNGVLHITVPKAQAAQARKIEIRTVAQSSERIQPPSTAKD
jgi:HSP20 family protein